MMVKTSGKQLIYSPFWITLLLTLIPMIKITKNLEMAKILRVSLIGILSSVSFFYVFPVLNYSILSAHKVVFGIFFGFALPPVLVLIYRLLQGYNSYFYVNFVFCLGTSCFSLLTIYLEGLHLIQPPLLGVPLIALLLLSCLWIGNHYDIFHRKFSR